MELWYIIPLGLLYLCLFFMGWAAVFKLTADFNMNQESGSVFKYALGWGVYMAGMLGYPAIMLLLTGYTISKITGSP